jgi:serine protease AprX
MTAPVDREQVAAARAEVRRVLGAAVEAKASDAFCLALQRRMAARAAAGLEDVASTGPRAAPPAATVVEFGAPTVGEGVAALGREERSRLAAAARAVRRVAPDDVAVRPEGVLRQALVASARTARYRLIAPVYDEIERLSGGALPPGREVLGDPQIPTLVNQICWLNGTLRTWAGAESLAEVAGAPAVTGLDVPRRLMPDATPRGHVSIGLRRFQGRRAQTGRGITVAVIDSEVALAHPALAGRVVHRRNFTAEPWGNPDSHGTAVAGIIGADDPREGGVAPGVTIYNYKVLATNRFLNTDDFGGAFAIQQALEDGADLANCSWGAGPTGTMPSREARAVDEAAALGMATIKSAGNKGPGAATMTTPADAATAIVVGATDLDGVAGQDYSARGPAGTRPGPDVVAPGGTRDDPPICALVGGGFGDAGAGTSFAAPLVTGVLAVLLERQPGLLPTELRQWVRDHARPYAGVAEAAQGLGLFVAG